MRAQTSRRDRNMKLVFARLSSVLRVSRASGAAPGLRAASVSRGGGVCAVGRGGAAERPSRGCFWQWACLLLDRSYAALLADGVAESVGPVGWEDSVPVCVLGPGAAGTPGLDGSVLSATPKPGRQNSQLRGRGLTVARKDDHRRTAWRGLVCSWSSRWRFPCHSRVCDGPGRAGSLPRRWQR